MRRTVGVVVVAAILAGCASTPLSRSAGAGAGVSLMVIGGVGVAGSLAAAAVLSGQGVDGGPMLAGAGISLALAVAGGVAFGTAAEGYRDEAERAARVAEAERVRLAALERAVGIVRSKARTSASTSTSTPAPVRVREPGREGMREPLVPGPGI